MRSHSAAPVPKPLSRARLLWPPVISASILLAVWLTDRAGHHWNVHGDAIGAMLAFGGSLVIGGVVCLFALLSALLALVRYPSLRTTANIASAVIAALFVASAAGTLLYVAFLLAESSRQ